VTPRDSESEAILRDEKSQVTPKDSESEAVLRDDGVRVSTSTSLGSAEDALGNGRRLLNVLEGEREDEMHDVLFDAVGDLCLAPVATASDVLDVGTGRGKWAIACKHVSPYRYSVAVR
jgi:hypothetical protein